MFSGVCQNATRPAVLLHHLYRSTYNLLQPKWAGEAQHSPQHQWQSEYERQHRSYIWTKTGWSCLFVTRLSCQADCICGVGWQTHTIHTILSRVLQLQSLLPFQQVSPTENVMDEYGLKDADLPKLLFSWVPLLRGCPPYKESPFLMLITVLAASQGLCHKETMVSGEVPQTGSSFSSTIDHVIPLK